MFSKFVVLAGALMCVRAEDEKAADEAVVALTTASFDDFLKENPQTLVEFYAPWCGHCKALAPEYEKAAQELKGKIPLAKVDATEESELGQRFGVQGYPTLKWFQDGEPSDFDGGRTGDAIVEWIKTMTGPAVAEVEEAAEATAAKPVVVLTGAEISESFEKLAKGNRKAATFNFIKGDSTEISIQHKGESKIVFDGDASDADALSTFFKTNKMPLFGILDGDTFSNYMESGEGLVWSLFPMEEGEEADAVGDKHREMMTEVAKAFPGKYRVTYTDTGKFKDAIESMLGVSTFPAIAVNKKAGDKKKFLYDGEMTAANIKQFIEDVDAGKIEPKLKSEAAPESNDGPVKVITGSTFMDMVFTEDKDVLLEIYAPWCGHCKKLEPEWEKVGKKVQKDGLDNMITIAKIDGTANDSPVDSIEWSGFPTIYFIKAGSKEPVKFDGGRTAKDIWKWVKKNSSHSEKINEMIKAKKAASDDDKKKEEL